MTTLLSICFNLVWRKHHAIYQRSIHLFTHLLILSRSQILVKKELLTSLRLFWSKYHAIYRRSIQLWILRTSSHSRFSLLSLSNEMFLSRVCKRQYSISVLLTSLRLFWRKYSSIYQRSVQLSWILVISSQSTRFLLLSLANDLCLQRYLKSLLSTSLRLFRRKDSLKCKRIVQYQALVHLHLRISRNRDLFKIDVFDRYSKSVLLTSFRLYQSKIHAICQRAVMRISRISLKSSLLRNSSIDLLFLRVCRSHHSKSALLTSLRLFWSKCHAVYQKSMQLSWISMISNLRMTLLLLSFANELSSLQKRRFLILRLHHMRYRKARSYHISRRILKQWKSRIKHVLKTLLMWRLWIRRFLLWSSYMTRSRKARSHRTLRISRFRSQWICHLLNISSSRMFMLLKFLILLLQQVNLRKIREYNKSRIRRHWRRIRSTSTSFLYCLSLISTLISTSTFVLLTSKQSNLMQRNRLSVNFLRFLHSIWVLISTSKSIQRISKQNHLTEVVRSLLLIDASFRFQSVLFLYRTSFLLRMSLLLILWISNSVRESSLSASLLSFLSRRLLSTSLNRIRTSVRESSLCLSASLILLFQLSLNALLARIRTSMRKSSSASLLMILLLRLLLLLWISTRSFWSLTWLRRRNLLECRLWTRYYFYSHICLLSIWSRNWNTRDYRRWKSRITNVEAYRIKKSINRCWDICRIHIQNRSVLWHSTKIKTLEIIAKYACKVITFSNAQLRINTFEISVVFAYKMILFFDSLQHQGNRKWLCSRKLTVFELEADFFEIWFLK